MTSAEGRQQYVQVVLQMMQFWRKWRPMWQPLKLLIACCVCTCLLIFFPLNFAEM
jgi:RsiW-degrading membrane proteinase PrsW (M82 family)